MKKILAIAVIASLAACAEADTEADTEIAAEPATEEIAIAPGTVTPGNYVVTGDFAGESPFTINADGTWTSVDEEGNPESGTSEIVNGQICFTTEGETEAECWTNGEVAEDGSFTSVGPEGRTVTVTPAI